MTDIGRALGAYARFYEGMSRDTLPQIETLLAPEIRFRDPFNDVRGPANIVKILTMMYQHGTPRFEVTDQAVGAEAGYLRWRYTSDPGTGAPPWIIIGMSELHFDRDGRVVEHIDHWDAAGQFYERIKLIGWLLRRVKRRLRVA